MDPGKALLEWLNSLPDADSVAMMRWLADNKASGPVVSSYADDRVWRLTRDASAKDVAAVLDMTVPQVNKAIRRRNLRVGHGTPAARRRSVA